MYTERGPNMLSHLIIGACEFAAVFTIMSAVDGRERWKQGPTIRALRGLVLSFCIWFVIGLPLNLIHLAWPSAWGGTSQWWRVSGVYISGISLALCATLIAFGLFRQRGRNGTRAF